MPSVTTLHLSGGQSRLSCNALIAPLVSTADSVWRRGETWNSANPQSDWLAGARIYVPRISIGHFFGAVTACGSSKVRQGLWLLTFNAANHYSLSLRSKAFSVSSELFLVSGGFLLTSRAAKTGWSCTDGRLQIVILSSPFGNYHSVILRYW